MQRSTDLCVDQGHSKYLYKYMQQDCKAMVNRLQGCTIQCVIPPPKDRRMTMPEALKQSSPPPHQSRKTARELRGGAARSQHVEQFSPAPRAREVVLIFYKSALDREQGLRAGCGLESFSPSPPSPLKYRYKLCVTNMTTLQMLSSLTRERTNHKAHGHVFLRATHLVRPDRVDRSWTLGGRVPLRQRRAAILRAQCSAAPIRRLAFWF